MANRKTTSVAMELYQSKYHFDEECVKILNDCENRYLFEDEVELFSNLVNFSTAKDQPYQRWVRYREGYSTLLVKELMHRSGVSSDSHFVADPMMGSGSTLVACKSEGFDALGIDVNPYCKLIAKLKLFNPSETLISEVRELLDSCAWREEKISENDRPPLADYFPETNLIEVLKIRKWLDKLPDKPAKDILVAAWFFALENSSNRKKDGNGLATRPAPIEDVESYYVGIVQDIISDFELHPMPDNRSYIETRSAFEFSKCVDDFKAEVGKELGCVIFSPPYANSFDYFESYKLELLFGKMIEFDNFNEEKKHLIRNYRICKKDDIECDIDIAEALCREIKIQIPKKEAVTGKRDGRTRLMPNMIRGYFLDMRKSIAQIYESLAIGGRCYIVVDQSAYVGVIVPTDIILALLAERIGFNVEKISVCRKASTSGQQLKQYPYLKNTLRESIVCLKKDH